MKTIYVDHFAQLKEILGTSGGAVQTNADTVEEFFYEISKHKKFAMDIRLLKVAVNDHITLWEARLRDGDRVVFIPPVSGG